MEITFNTCNLDASVALKALQLYKAKKYKEAIPALQEILDVEPKNWDARLLLGACYYKTAQYPSAQRLFQFIYDAPGVPQATRIKAQQALRAVAMAKEGLSDLPAEFGCYAQLNSKAHTNWLMEA
ncbi:MAG: tetratricopeptide repeat protein [Candidatus Obscuribacterales bacterium]|nr:tetratricopeptide repeat protein [Candidatus Obscuribacterales bacterium]